MLAVLKHVNIYLQNWSIYFYDNIPYMIKNVLLCGLGATGCIFADKIKKSDDINLKILVDKSRFERYSKTPMELNGEVIEFDYILPENDDFKADLILITTKSDGLLSAVENIKNFVSDNTIIMSLLNGISSEKIIAEKYGANKVITSYWIGHSAMRDGNKVVHDGVAKIVFGSKDKSDKRLEDIKDLFEKSHINYEIPEDIEYSIWLKYLMNVSTNQPSAVYNMTFGEMRKSKEVRELIKNLMEEVQKIAKAEGVKNTDRMYEDAKKSLRTMMSEGKTSMLQDVLAKRKTEVDIFAGTIIKLGQKHNIPTPYNQMMKEKIDTIHLNY